MTAKSSKFRLPRKTVFIIGGALLFGGATGAFALYMTKDRFLGGAEDDKKTIASLTCTTVKTFKIKKKDRFWVRKFIKTEPAEGLVRVATALRVAEAVYSAEKPDLVQVVVLDQRGPEQRADMRGRAIGADVVYVPHPDKIADLANTPVYTAKYIDGAANDGGQFYGEKIQLPPEHIESLISMLSDHSDCSDPAAAEEAAKGEAAEGKKKGKGKGEAAEKAEGEGEEKAKSEEGAEKAPAEGESAPSENKAGEGETPVAEAPAEPPAEKPVAEAPAEKPVAADSAEKSAAEAPAEAAVREPVAEVPAEKPAEASAAEAPAAEKPENAAAEGGHGPAAEQAASQERNEPAPPVSNEQTSAPGAPQGAAPVKAMVKAQDADETVVAAKDADKPAIVEDSAAKPEAVKPEADKSKKHASAKPQAAPQPEHGASAKIADSAKVSAKEEAASPQYFYDEPSVSDGG